MYQRTKDKKHHVFGVDPSIIEPFKNFIGDIYFLLKNISHALFCDSFNSHVSDQFKGFFYSNPAPGSRLGELCFKITIYQRDWWLRNEKIIIISYHSYKHIKWCYIKLFKIEMLSLTSLFQRQNIWLNNCDLFYKLIFMGN